MKKLLWINIATVVVGVITAGWLVVTARGAATDDRDLKTLLEKNAAAAEAGMSATLAMAQQVQNSLTNPHEVTTAAKKEEADQAFAAAIAQMRSVAINPDTRRLIDEIAKADEAVLDPNEDRVVALAAKDPKAATDLFFKEYIPAQAEQLKRLGRLEVHEASRLLASQAADSSSVATVTMWIALIVFSILIAAVTVTIRRVFQALQTAFGELSEGANEVVAAARQVSTSSQSLSQGATEQAASLEETSASTEEMASMTRRNAESSREGAALATRLETEVQASSAALDEMVVSMSAIQDSSRQVAKIIRTIDEIAFQTNILALNAAVEAARAGEAGMGFAVVADEVRNLAQRSAQAAKDTAGMIEASIARAEAGTQQVERVATAINSLTDGVVRVKTIVEGVNGASQEQTRGIDQIAQAVTLMEKVTQTTAATAEESAAASEELNAQAESTLATVRRLEALMGRSSSVAAAPAKSHGAKGTVIRMPAPAPAKTRGTTRQTSAEDMLPLEDTGTYGRF